MNNEEIELSEVVINDIEELEEVVTPGSGFGCDC